MGGKTRQGNLHLQVACAVIENNGLILAAQRSAAMSLPLAWEFPGGKLEPGENLHACLQRELMEEMGLTVSIGESLTPRTFHYPDFSVTLHPFYCTIDSGTISLHEHCAAEWLPAEQLHTLAWAEADLPIVREIQISSVKQVIPVTTPLYT